MRKPLLERLALDLKPSGRLPDCRRDLAEAEQERAQIDERIAECEQRSEDPSTPDDEARLALQQSQDWRFHARRLDRAIADLRANIAAKEADQAHVERRKEFDVAKAARDALVERWRALGPVFDDLFALFADTVANDAVIAKINQHRPGGEPALRSAEMVARGPLNTTNWANSIGQNGEPFTRFTEMDWAFLDKPGLAWSRDGLRTAHAASISALQSAFAAIDAAKSPEGIEEQRKRAPRYGRFEVSQPRYSGSGRIRVVHRDGVAGIGNEPVKLWLHQGQVDAAKAAGLAVEALEEHV